MEDNELFYNAEDMKEIVSVNPDAVRFYKNTVSKEDYDATQYVGGGLNQYKDSIILSVYQEAYNHGLEIGLELIEKYPELCQNNMFFYFILSIDSNNSFYVQFYEGEDIGVYIEAIKCGYKMFPQEIERFSYNADDMKRLVAVYPLAIQYYENSVTGNDIFSYTVGDYYYDGKEKQKEKVFPVYYEAFNHGLEINEELFEKYPSLCSNDVFMYLVLDKNKDFVKYYTGNNEYIYIKAMEMGYSIQASDVEKLSTNDSLFFYLIDKDPMWDKFLYYYRGDNPKVFQKAVEKGYQISLGDVLSHKNDTEIFKYFIKLDFKWLAYYGGDDPSVFLEAIDLYSIDLDYNYIGKFSNNEKIMREFIKRDSLYAVYYTGDNREEILKSVHLDVTFPTDSIKYYKGNVRELFNHYNDLCLLLSDSGISVDDFNHYLLGSDIDWIKYVIDICSDEEKRKEFIEFNHYMNEYYYEDRDDIVSRLDNYMDCFINYKRYPELCSSLIKKEELDENDLNNIEWLFHMKEEVAEEFKPKSLSDFNHIKEYLLESYQKGVDYSDINSIKNTICRMLFNEDMIVLQNKLNSYGNTARIKELQFNDRESSYIKKLGDEIIIYTSMIEDVIECSDIRHLKNVLKGLFQNFDFVVECSRMFDSFDEKIRRLYEADIQQMLTKANDLDNGYEKIDGIDVYDLSNKPYVLLVHVKSLNETVDEVAKGERREDRNFISMSAISYRNQMIFGNEKSLIFGYDTLPEHLFISSSIGDVVSNGMVQRYDYQFRPNTSLNQRGILESSLGSEGYNSEVICYREGMKPSYIVLPGGREANEDEKLIAINYGLKFVKTQALGKRIHDVEKIEKEKDTNYSIISEDDLTLKKTWDNINKKDNKPRRIAVFADAHAMFEPTLAVLEDIRKKGIDEIYSLGDNIGSGPNPREVMELLDQYHVQSLMGNHELYVIKGALAFKEHLKDGAYKEAKRNSDFTRRELTDKQIQNIKMYPSFVGLSLGGERILLCHTHLDYNTNQPIVDTDRYSLVLRGHSHFEENDKNIRTVRSSSFGKKSSSKEAYYLILTERENGGFDIEVCTVDYNRKNLMADIDESDLSYNDRNKIRGWL